VIYLAGAAPLFRRALNRRLMKTLLGAVVARRELITPEVVDAYLNPFLDTGEATHTFIAATSVLSDSRLPGALAEVKSEVLIAYGERDRMVTRRSIERLAELLPRVQLLTHPEGGHHIMEDEPAWTARHLEEFFLLGTSAATSVK
jgi:pimeloyl-ACP methyl ester carboxylesterase